MSIVKLVSVAGRTGLSLTWQENPNTGFVTSAQVSYFVPAKRALISRQRREPLCSKSTESLGWLQSTRAQDIPFWCTWLLKKVIFFLIYSTTKKPASFFKWPRFVTNLVKI